MDPNPLDPFLPVPDIRERHEIHIAAPPGVVMALARDFDMQSIAPVRAIFWLRERLFGSKSQAVRRPEGLLAEMLSLGWGILEDSPGRLMAGAVCQPWLADVVFRPVEQGQFPLYAEPDCVRIAWFLETSAACDGGTNLITETRAAANGGEAQRKFRRYWRKVRPGVISIRWLLLRAIKRKAEASTDA